MDREVLIGIGSGWLGVALAALAGILLHLAVKRGLKQLVRQEIITQPVYRVGRGISRWLIIIIVVSLILQRLGLSLSHVFTALLAVAGMVAVGFVAVWSTLSNVMCAFILIVLDHFRIGDLVEIVEPVGGEGLKGRVSDFNLMFTTVEETPKQEGEAPPFTRIPNNVFFQKSLRRWPGTATMGLGGHLLRRPVAGLGLSRREP